MKITIVNGHPDRSESHLNHALAQRYAQAAIAAGHDVRRIDVAKLDFEVMRDPKDFVEGKACEDIARAQDDLRWGDHWAFFYPLWMSDVPALFKAFMEQTFRPGFALDYGLGPLRLPKRLLKGKSARIVVTMGMPRFFYYGPMGAYMLKLMRRLLNFAGVSPVEETVIGGVENPSQPTVRKWFEKMERLALEDGRRHPHRAASMVRVLATIAVGAGASYLGYALTSWARYGATRSSLPTDSLLDRYMPNYEVGLRHATVVNAPAGVAFSAIRLSDFERSPIVRFLFSARDLLMRNRAVLNEPASLPFEKLTSIGWGVLSIDPGKEIVLGTVTQPWRSKVTFRAVPAEEFVRSSEPGFAKIALSIRVDEVSSEHCEARTETRVQTTDPISRARFRRYWALLSPGMAIIRRVLLQQIKADAEAIWMQKRDRAAAGSPVE